MTRSDIIKMAKEAGFETAHDWVHYPNGFVVVVERFAAIVAAAERRRLQAQRDALLEAMKDATKTIEHFGYFLAAIERACAAIKAVEGDKK